jgi:MoaA/NifB/PqqE/SkfB family radical SAM enzyme
MFNSPIRDLHIELTSRCTLMCPRCQRTAHPNELTIQDVSPATISATVTKKNFPNLRFVTFCGNYGDPIYHPQFHEIVEHVKKEGLKINFDTNASYRNRAWWQKTASMLARSDRATFSIDGLEDTNPVYRVNARWPDIMIAVEEMRDRARLIWKFIVFRHNQHQIEEAKSLAKRLGFDEFKLRRSNRYDGPWIKSGKGEDPLKPDAKWLSDRMRVEKQIGEMRGARN